MVNNSIEKAQRKVEGRNFDIRKNLLEYDDVANDQRQVIYQQRNDLMGTVDLSETIRAIRDEVVEDVISDYVPPQSIDDQWDIEGLEQALATEFDSKQPVAQWLADDDELNEETLRDRIREQLIGEYEAKEGEWVEQGVDMRSVEKQIMLSILDQKWKEHLAVMDHLRQGIHLRAYAQKQPKQEYKREAFILFQDLLANIKRDVVRLLSRVRIEPERDLEEVERRRREELAQRTRFQHAGASALGNAPAADGDGASSGAAKPETFVRGQRKVGRNERCPCGSGKKYKHCCGKAA